jgi:tRNA(adenine34) deaminase
VTGYAPSPVAGPTGPGRRQRHELWMRRALEIAATGPLIEPPSGPLIEPPSGPFPGPPSGPFPGAGAVGASVRDGDVAAGGTLVGDIPVGAVIYGPDGAELAVGRNERELTGDPTAHAEVLALRRAAARRGHWRLDGCTLVVTLEPCTMCAGALVLARIATVVFGAWEPKTGAVGSLWDVLRDRRLNHRPEVYGGVLETESAALLRAFFC